MWICVFLTLLLQGGEIGINIEWKCNLDLDIEYCLPKYKFTRLDAPFAKNTISSGYNFRYFSSSCSNYFFSFFIFWSLSFPSLWIQICQIFPDGEWDGISDASQSVCHPLWRHGHRQSELCDSGVRPWPWLNGLNIIEYYLCWRAVLLGDVCTLRHPNRLHLSRQAGKFDIIPTLINLVAAFTSVGLVGKSHQAKDGSVGCRLWL